MKKLKNFFPMSAAIFVLIGLSASWSTAGVSQYVRKYEQARVSGNQIADIARYDHLIEYFSSFAYIKPRHKVNPDFIRALILAESAVNPQAVSRKNALGLSQIIYETGKIAARELAEKPLSLNLRYVSHSQLKNLKPKDLYDPAINILLACYLIAKYNDAFGGRLDLVVSAWNAGANSITNSTAPEYEETLNLIGKVNGYFVYLLNKKQKVVRYAYRR